MRISIFALILSCVYSLVLAATAFAGSDTDLSQWGSRHKDELGTVLNMPMGSVDGEIRSGQAEVEALLTKLVPNLFQNYQLVINIFSSQKPNAFIERVKGQDLKNPVLTNGYHLDLNKPIYVIGVTLGLLNAMPNESRLAAVLAHELIHLFEGHVDKFNERDDEERYKKWWHSQQFEAVADYRSLPLLLGKFDIEASVENIWYFASLEKFEPYDDGYVDEFLSVVSDGLQAATRSHHDDLLRISMLQAQVKYLRRTHPDAQAFNSKPLNFRIYRQPRKPSIDNSPAEIETIRKYHKYLMEVAEASSGILDSITIQYPNRRLLEHEFGESAAKRYLFSGPTRRLLIRETIQDLTQSSLPPGKKADTLIYFYFLYNSVFESEGQYKGALPDDMALAREVATALLPWMRDKTWNPKRTARDLLGYYSEFVGRSFSVFAGGRSETLFFLTKNIPQFNALFGSLIEHFITNDQRKIDSGKIVGFMHEVYSTERVKSEDPMTKNIFRMLNRHLLPFAQNLEPLSTEILDSYHSLNNVTGLEYLIREGLAQKMYGPELLKVAQAFLDKTFESLVQVRKAVINNLLTSSQFDAEAFNELTRHLSYIKYRPFSKEDQANLRTILMKFTNDILGDPKMMATLSDDDETAKNLSQLYRNILQRSKSELTATEATDALTLLASLGSDGYDDLDEKPNEQKLILKLISAAGPKNVFELVTRRLPSIDQAISEAAAKVNPWYTENVTPFLRVMPKRASTTETIADWGSRERRSEFFPLLSIKSNLRRYLLKYLGWANFGKELKLEDLDNLFNFMETEARQDDVQSQKLFDSNHFSFKVKRQKLDGESADVLAQAFAAEQPNIPDLKTWFYYFNKIYDLSSSSLFSNSERVQVLSRRLHELAATASPLQFYKYLKSHKLNRLLSPDATTPRLVDYVASQVSASDPSQIKAAIDKVDIELSLKNSLPDIYVSLRNKVAEKFRLQPSNVNVVFPKDEHKVDTQSTEHLASSIRGLSTMTAITKHLSVKDKFEVIDYLMGRTDKMPFVFSDFQQRFNEPANEWARSLKDHLSQKLRFERGFFITSLFAGPHSPLENPQDLDKVLDHLIPPSPTKSAAKQIAQALLKSQGRFKSLAIGYILSEKQLDQRPMTEGEFLRALFEAFGPAGIKLGQYLAFTGDMSSYRDELSKLQNAAMPITYLDAIQLIERRLGSDWSDNYTFVGILGSGSVNVALEIKLADKSGREMVISVLRQDIETLMREDFSNLRSFAHELLKIDWLQKSFPYLSGLVDVIEESVKLELNKENSLKMQQAASSIYSTTDKYGWKLTAPTADQVLNGSLLMAKGPGKSAVEIRQTNFDLYKYAMNRLLEREFAILTGRLGSQALYFANPDIHDGQVLIDEATKTITVLDFGQALSISNAERQLGFDILKVLNANEQFDSSIKKLLARNAGAQLSAAEIQIIKSKRNPMERFTVLLGLSKQHCWNIPLATTHWILSFNRLKELGRIIDVDVSARMRNAYVVQSCKDILGRLGRTFSKAR